MSEIEWSDWAMLITIGLFMVFVVLNLMKGG